MAIDLKMYYYSAERWVANKLAVASMATPVFDSSGIAGFSVRKSVFTPLRAEFILSTLYSANYCSYVFNGITYYGYLTIATEGDGLYLYTVDVDALTTAWYAGCMAAPNNVIYSNSGSALRFDNRNPLHSHAVTIEATIGSSLTNPIIIMTLVDPYDQGRYHGNDARTGQTPGALRSIVFFDDAGITAAQSFIHFCTNLIEVDQWAFKKIGPLLDSVRSVLIIPDVFLTNKTQTALWLNAIPTDVVEAVSATLSVPKSGSGYTDVSGGECNEWVTNSIVHNRIVTQTYEIALASYKQDDIWAGTWNVILPYIGRVSIIPQGFIPSTASHITLTVLPNIFGEFYTVRIGYRTVSGGAITPIDALTQTFPMMEKIPYPRAGQSGSSDASILNGIVGTVASVIAKNYAGAATSAISMIEAAATPAGVGAGNVGGSPYRATSLTPQFPILTITYQPHVNSPSSYASHWGRPDGAIRDVSTLTGYAQTEHCELYHLGLPTDIISAAEDALDAGVFIL